MCLRVKVYIFEEKKFAIRKNSLNYIVKKFFLKRKKYIGIYEKKNWDAIKTLVR